VSVERATLCAEYADGSVTRGEVEVDEGHARGHRVTRVWLEPHARIHPAVRKAITSFNAVIIGPGSFFTSLMPTLLVGGVADRLRAVDGPIILVTNLLTEGHGMHGFTAADAVAWVGRTINRPVDVVIANEGHPSDDVLTRYRAEDKEPLEIGNVPAGTEVVTGRFWQSEIARHHRRRLSYAVWAVLARRLFI
jgi:uncharacterized cofD-like protein